MSNIIMFTKEEIIESTGAKLIGIPKMIEGISTDTRSIKRGDLFVALCGETFDGNEFVEQAKIKGAAAVLTQSESKNDIAQFIVKDTNKALLDLASFYRRKFDFPIIGVTGSFGKTTVKEMIAAILAKIGAPVFNKKNFNNHIGVPITLFDFDKINSHAVVEMGMNHSGEINLLSKCTKPDVAVITGIGAAHIEFFDSVRDIADAKLEILNGLKKNGTVILPNDDSLFSYLKAKTENLSDKDLNVVTFGTLNNPDFKFVCDEFSINGVKGKIVSKNHQINLNLKMIGKHNGTNAAAATAAVLTICPEMNINLIEAAFEEMNEIEMRCEIKNINGISFILDCYNANLDSGVAALNTLAEIEAKGKKIAVLGDMLEQGSLADENHYKLGEKVAEKNIDLLITVGDYSLIIKKGAIENSMNPENIFAFDDKVSATNFLKENLETEDVLLLKASRKMKLETLINKIDNK